MLRRLSTVLLAAALIGAAPDVSAGTPGPTGDGPTATPMASSITTPAAAPIDPVTEKLWNTTVVDRYRYMENPTDPRTKAFFDNQATATTNYLNNLGAARTALGLRIRQLDRSSVSVGSVTRVANQYFFERQDAAAESASLYVRSANGGPARLLVDPTLEGNAHSHHTLDWFVPSLDGHYVAFGLSAGGSEDSILHIIDARTGERLPETIDRARFGATSWLPDGKTLLYLRLPITTSTTPVTDRERFTREYTHRVGDPVSKDRAVMGWQVDPHIPLAPDDVPAITSAANSPYVVAGIQHGVLNEVTLYFTTASDVAAGHPHWTKIADIADAITSFDIHGSMLYALSHRNASMFRVLSMDLKHPGAFTDLVRPSRAVIEQIGVAHNGVYLRLLDGGIGKVSRVAFASHAADALLNTIDLPYDGSITSIATDPRVSGVTFGLTGWTHSLLWYSSINAQAIVDTKLKPVSPIDTSLYTSREVLAHSADGTAVPLSIIMKKGTVLDGSHPTYLEGYGAYGVTLSPYFSGTRIAWLERGGVYAIAHVRGGGEFGENWHHAAMRANKVRSIDDFIACAHYLINNHYTSPSYLAGEGTSAGGIVIGGAITRAPELFAAALDVVGVSDALRSEFSANGPSNIPEFGTVKIQKEFQSLLATDAYQQVRNGVAYPAVLLITGINDPRVPSWELAKFAARLQAATSSGKPVLLRIDRDGGHGFLAASRTQSEKLLTDQYSFLLEQMGKLNVVEPTPIPSPAAI